MLIDYYDDDGLPPSDPYVRGHYVKNPVVVLRTDGRYGVARAGNGTAPRGVSPYSPEGNYFDNERQFHRFLGHVRVDTSGTSGFVHEERTYKTRREAEARAYALAREIGNTKSWP
jgi:hypothetical protein